MSCQLAVIQMVSSANTADNLTVAQNYMIQAVKQGAQLVALPENFSCMAKEERDKIAIAETDGDGPVQTWLSKMARELGIYILGGTIPIKVPGKEKVYAASMMYNDQGERIACYHKIHLFDVTVEEGESYHESSAIEPGSEVVVVDTPLGRAGLTVCYDLRFAELYRQLVSKEVDFLCVPAAFTAITGLAHWEVLLRARAIENLTYVVAPNQGGIHDNDRRTFGHSMIVDPWGKIMANAGTCSGPIYADIDLDYLRQIRAQFPCNQHHVMS